MPTYVISLDDLAFIHMCKNFKIWVSSINMKLKAVPKEQCHSPAPTDMLRLSLNWWVLDHRHRHRFNPLSHRLPQLDWDFARTLSHKTLNCPFVLALYSAYIPNTWVCCSVVLCTHGSKVTSSTTASTYLWVFGQGLWPHPSSLGTRTGSHGQQHGQGEKRISYKRSSKCVNCYLLIEMFCCLF